MELTSYLLGKKAGGGGGGDTPDLSEYLITELTKDTSNQSDDTTYRDLVIKTAPLKLSSSVRNLSYCFVNSRVVEFQFDKENFDTSEITNLSNMFNNCRNITNLDLSFFNTSKVGTFDGMFSYCSNLIKINISSFSNMRNASIREMFRGCNKLAVIDMSNMYIPQYSSSKSNFFNNTGINCLKSDGAYADGIPYVYVGWSDMRDDILNNKSQWGTPSSWTTANVIATKQ